MSIEDFPAVFLNLLSLIPVGIFFYIPMRGRMKRSIPKNMLMVFLPQLLLIVLASFVAIRFDLEPNTVRISLFIVFFPIYYKSLDVDMSRAISVYIYIHSMVIIMNSAWTLILISFNGESNRSMASVSIVGDVVYVNRELIRISTIIRTEINTAV